MMVIRMLAVIQKRSKYCVHICVGRELQIYTNEEIEDVDTRALGPRTLRSGREIGKVTWDI